MTDSIPQENQLFSGKKILVVDDNAFVCELISNVLVKFLKIEVYKARGGSQAIAAALTGTYDGAIIDLAMAGTSSSKIIHAIKTMLPAFPILAISAHPTDEIAATLRRYGVTQILRKPFKMTSLIEEITRMLGAGKALPVQDRS